MGPPSVAPRMAARPEGGREPMTPPRVAPKMVAQPGPRRGAGAPAGPAGLGPLGCLVCGAGGPKSWCGRGAPPAAPAGR